MSGPTALLVTTLLATPAAVPSTAPSPPSDPDSTSADDLYTHGQARLEAQDFDGASRSWERMLAALPESQASRSTRENLIINIIDARLAAYHQLVDGKGRRDPLHLHIARQALRRYYRDFRRAYSDRIGVGAAVQDRAAAVQAALSGLENPPVPTPAASSSPPPAPPRPARDDAPAPIPETSLRPAWLGVGIGVGLVGLAAGLTMIPLGATQGKNAENVYTVALIHAQASTHGPRRARALADARDARRAGRAANRVVTAGVVITPLLLGASAVMIAYGLGARRRAARPRRLSQAPEMSRTYAGWKSVVRF